MGTLEEFLKKDKRKQVFNDICTALPPYPGFNVRKKAYWGVTQWQDKEMPNPGCCISAVFASALRNLDGSQQLPFKRALECVCALIKFHSDDSVSQSYSWDSWLHGNISPDLSQNQRHFSWILYNQGYTPTGTTSGLGIEGTNCQCGQNYWYRWIRPQPTSVGGRSSNWKGQPVGRIDKRRKPL